MNKRIRKFAEECSHHRSPPETWFDYEKFAEFIAQECIEQINQAIPDTNCSAEGYYRTAKIAAVSRVKHHFKIKE